MKLVTDAAPYYLEFDDPSVQEMKDLLDSGELQGNLYSPYNRADALVAPMRTASEIYKKPLFNTFHIFTYNLEAARKILSIVPCARYLGMNPFRVSLFMTPPGFFYRPHKDGLDIRCGINYPIFIQDDKCVTSWYDEASVSHLGVNTTSKNTSRELVGFDAEQHLPVHSYTMRDDRIVFFNTDMWHSFTNASPHWRAILTIRPMITSLDFAAGAARLRSRA